MTSEFFFKGRSRGRLGLEAVWREFFTWFFFYEDPVFATPSKLQARNLPVFEWAKELSSPFSLIVAFFFTPHFCLPLMNFYLPNPLSLRADPLSW